MKRSDTHGPNGDPLDEPIAEGVLEPGRRRALPRSAGEHETHRSGFEPVERERERRRRCRVEPLDVVDRDDNGLVGREQLERAPDTGGDRARIDFHGRAFFEEQRQLERSAPRSRQEGKHVVEDVFQ